ncbi:MAG: 3'-5' exoribonuclease domain-containing protein [Actinomycetota bacterium]
MRYFFDTEFIEGKARVDLVSIGVVSEDGRELYAISTEFDRSAAGAWVTENVLSKLEAVDSGLWLSRDAICRELVSFVGSDVPEFWAYYGAYDWVAVAQLFGTWGDMPTEWPYFRDLKQWAVFLGDPVLPPQEGEPHHALNDARHNRVLYEFLAAYEGRNR